MARAPSSIFVTAIALALGACGSAEAHGGGEPRASAEAVTTAQSAAPEADVTAPEVTPPEVTPPDGEAAPPVESGVPGPWTEERTVASAPYPANGAPSVIVHAPPTFDARGPLDLVVFVHGWSGCARQLAGSGPVRCRDTERAREGWGLAERFDEAGVDALFVVPQLAYLARDGRPGRFLEEGRFRAFLEETFAALEARLGPGATARLRSITLLAHSAGFETALALLSRGGVDAHLRHLVLFDALYRGVEPFASWAGRDPARRLVSLYTGGGRTASQSRMLAGRARTLLGDGAVRFDDEAPLAAQVSTHRVVIARSPAPHSEVPARHMVELLEVLLPSRSAPSSQTPGGQVHSGP